MKGYEKMRKISLVLFALAISVITFMPITAHASNMGFKYNYPNGDNGRSIIVTKSGMMYLVALSGNRGKLIALSPEGKTLWSKLGVAGQEMLIVTDKQERVYSSVGKTLTAYDKTGKTRWTKTFSEPQNLNSTNEHILVVDTDKIMAYSNDGKLVYQLKLNGGEVNPPRGTDDFWIASEQNNDMVLYKANRKLFKIPQLSTHDVGRFAVSADKKTIYIPYNTNKSNALSTLRAYNLNGNLLWQTQIPGKTEMIDKIAPLENGKIATYEFSSSTIKIYEKTGEFIWSKATSSSGADTIQTIGNAIYHGADIYNDQGTLVVSLAKDGLPSYIGEDGSIVYYTSRSIEKILPPLRDTVGSWSMDSVLRLSDLGIIGGYPDGLFKPNKNVSKEEFLKMLLAAKPFESTTLPDSSPFSDVSTLRWSYSIIAKSVTSGILSVADEGGKFNPASAITREQMAVYTAKALKLPVTVTKPFSDASSITYHPDLISAAASSGIIGGYSDGSFKPKGNLTRAEAAVVITRVLDFEKQKDAK